MSNFDLDRLLDRPINGALDGLEARIWQSVATRERDRQTSRKTGAYQAAILVLAISVSAVLGVAAADKLREGSDLGSGAQHTPSQLLFGLQR